MKIIKKYIYEIFVIFIFLSIVIGIISILLPKGQKNSNGKSISATPFLLNKEKKGIYILNIYGTIHPGRSSSALISHTTGSDLWSSLIYKAKADHNVKGLLLRINSGGGTTGASQELYQAVSDFKNSGKKVIVSVADVCASGAYYTALPADLIICNQSSLIGSIGVIINSMEMSELFKKIGVNHNVIKSGEFKDLLDPSRKIKESEKLLLQKLIDSTYQQFLNDVISWKTNKMSEAQIRKIADGRIFNGSEALKLGLVDELGNLEYAKKRAAEICGLNYPKLHIIKYRDDRISDFIEMLNLSRLIHTGQSSIEYRYTGLLYE